VAEAGDGAPGHRDLPALLTELGAFRSGLAAEGGAAFGRLIDAGAAEVAARLRAQDGGRDEADLAFEALTLATAKVSLAVLRMLLDDDPAVVSMLGDESHARIVKALRDQLRAAPLNI
jgi:hypothetical protein